MADIAFALGFMNLGRDQDDKRFGHPGAGGTLGYGDAGLGLGFGYVSRSMGQALLVDYRAERLLEASYQALGYSWR